MGGDSDTVERAVIVESCGVCGSGLTKGTEQCPACWLPTNGTGVPFLTTWGLSQPLKTRQGLAAAACYGIDILVTLILAALGGLALGLLTLLVTGIGSLTWVIIGASLGLIGALAWGLASYRRQGRALGGFIFGFRHVDSRFFLPALPFVRLSGQGRSRLVDVRQGQDPFQVHLTAWNGLTNPQAKGARS
ncbi:MAG: hypothetical protein LBE83_01405 [Propionibacteriaceae bacterium]|jgi:hypothetical protein|nr:hypothetical protein [Propionibacteriaceae bacterium]